METRWYLSNVSHYTCTIRCFKRRPSKFLSALIQVEEMIETPFSFTLGLFWSTWIKSPSKWMENFGWSCCHQLDLTISMELTFHEWLLQLVFPKQLYDLIQFCRKNFHLGQILSCHHDKIHIIRTIWRLFYTSQFFIRTFA